MTENIFEEETEETKEQEEKKEEPKKQKDLLEELWEHETAWLK